MTPTKNINPPKQTANPPDSCTGAVSPARPLRYIAPKTSQAPSSSSFAGECPEGTRTTERPNVRASTHNHEHDTPTSTATQPLFPYGQSPEPNGTQYEGGPSSLLVKGSRRPQNAGGAGKRRHEVAQRAHTVDPEDEIQPSGKRVRAVRNRVGAECQNDETREPGGSSISRIAGVMPQVSIGLSKPSNRTYM